MAMVDELSSSKEVAGRIGSYVKDVRAEMKRVT